ncbi:MAG: hypothetical protein A2Z88_03130 [Omnitrophica WOR_2 bacterium GWA2_47_8]|nr:MAG: hypothetical protein A2Z88_03130 [Omnitrophica WOR_2 bacterium GWA2_47_8]
MFFRNALKGLLIFVMTVFPYPAFAQLNLDKLPEVDVLKVKNLLEKLAPLIEERDKKENLATLRFAELYEPLNEEEKAFLQSFQDIDAKEAGVKIPYRGLATGEEDLAVIKGQIVTKREVNEKKESKATNETKELPPQFLPKDVYEAYLRLTEAMNYDISRKVLVESGYRSSAYQLYLFIYYLKNHEYSMRETVKFVTLPGYSEHGAPKFQAIDFINADGINGEDNPEEFEALDEYKWLLTNGEKFGFILSYPKDAAGGITFEPWHWRYESDKDKSLPKDNPL